MKSLLAVALVLLSMTRVAFAAGPSMQSEPATPLKVGIVGLVHGHVGGFLEGGALTPAGGLLNRADAQLVGIVEPDQTLFDRYAAHYHLAPSLHFASIAAMVAQAHPQAALVFTPPSEHRRVVEECAALGVHVLMEKPLAVTYDDALAIERAAHKSKIHVLVDFETSWYPSNTEAYNLVAQNALGPIVKAVFRDGHQGPQKIGVQPEFLSWLTDPRQDGDGALIDFGCYGPDLMTWLLHGEAPQSVTAVAKHLQPELYPRVDDDLEMVLNYRNALAIVEGSWNWPFALKQMDVYGRTGYAKALDSSRIEVRKQGDAAAQSSNGHALEPPYDDPLHYMEAVLAGRVEEADSLSSLKTNVTVTEILDAARQSAQSGKTVSLPLTH